MLQIISFVLLGAMVVLCLKNVNSEIATVLIVVVGAILFGVALKYLSQIFSFVNYLANLGGINELFYKIILKTIAIGYLTEFGAEIVSDVGLKSWADKLVFIGKVMIFSVSLPIFYSVFNLLLGLVK
ncbi:MAG: hypothetical protein E7347_03735 [Clostridiales bacterium]|nr:hypothetical protein [Clostridiales bacterium]